MKNKYLNRILLQTIIIFCLCNFSLISQNRDLTGYGNNISNPTWGATGTAQLNVAPNGFLDNISEPGGVNRPNPRFISNAIFNQDGLIMDKIKLSDFAWVWGQFIDHDITLSEENTDESCNIQIPSGDIYFDPNNTGAVQLHMNRSKYIPGTGTSVENPRKFPNSITAFLDGSVVYGSDKERAHWLRTFVQGQLKMSEGGFLPYNTINGELDGEIDPNAPIMAMANPFASKWFIAGDVRANENILLTSIHTLFVREHNRLCEEIAISHPEYNDEQLYQRSKKIVGAIIQSIVYNDWLPTLGIKLKEYTGYDETVNPGIMNEFSAAAYRYGHTVISSDIIRLAEDGKPIEAGNIKLRDVYFQPNVLIDGGGVDPLFRGMGTQVEQEFDSKMISDLRNFLFGPPGAGGLDLAAMNIMRGRERGLADYNTIRESFGLPRIENFENMTGDPYLNTLLKNTYKDINNIDPWVGFLSENHMENSLFGESVMKIVGNQFLNLRDGDRFYYINDLDLSIDDLEFIESSTLGAIICRNTGVKHMQDNVFLAEPMELSSVDYVFNDSEYLLFPNPANAQFNISSQNSTSDICNIFIYNALGSKISSIEKIELGNGNVYNVSIENFESGLYSVVIQSKDKISSHKLIIGN